MKFYFYIIVQEHDTKTFVVVDSTIVAAESKHTSISTIIIIVTTVEPRSTRIDEISIFCNLIPILNVQYLFFSSNYYYSIKVNNTLKKTINLPFIISNEFQSLFTYHLIFVYVFIITNRN